MSANAAQFVTNVSRGWRRRGRPVRLATLALAAAVLAGCAGPGRPPREAAAWQTVELGLCEDYPEETRSLAAARDDLRLSREAGACVLRIAFGWDAMEPEPGRYDWSFWDEFVAAANAEGVRLIPYVCYTPRWAASDPGEDFWRSPPRDPRDFERFMRAIVGRYRDTIDSWELWNEPDNRAYWTGTPEQFAELVRAGAAGVRSADPGAVIVLGGIATELDFLETLFEDHGTAAAVDIVNLHAYFETWHPDPIEQLPNYVERAAEIVREHGEAEPLWLAETGYSSVAGRAVVSDVYRSRYRWEHDEVAQANALARTVLLGLSTGRLPLIAWYRINDLPAAETVIGDDNNRHLGVRRIDLEPKPALVVFAALARLFAQPFRVTAAAVQAAGDTADLQVHAFELRDGRFVVAAWLAGEGTGGSGAELRGDVRSAEVEIRLPIGATARVLPAFDGGELAGATAVRWRHDGGKTVLALRVRGGELRCCVVEP